VGRVLAEDRQGREPVHPGHADVEEDEVDLPPREHGQGGLAVGGADGVVAGELEARGQRVAEDCHVVDDQDRLGAARRCDWHGHPRGRMGTGRSVGSFVGRATAGLEGILGARRSCGGPARSP
jgi:hypothetical protein